MRFIKFSLQRNRNRKKKKKEKMLIVANKIIYLIFKN